MTAEKRRGFTAHPEFYDETLDQATRRADRAAARLHHVGVGAKVRLTRYAHKRNITLQKRANDTGVIVGFGDHRWTVKVRPLTYRKAGAFHARFWEPVNDRRGDERGGLPLSAVPSNPAS